MPSLLNPFEHGGNIRDLARRLGRPLADLLDFSASINPFGPPAEAIAAAREALAEVAHYPEIDAISLREALAQHHGLPSGCLLPGAGSTELIYLLPRVMQPRRALVVAPAFSEYQRSLIQAGCEVEYFSWRPGGAWQLRQLLEMVREDTDLVLLANPGNPAGNLLRAEQVRALVTALREQAVVLVDEAFIDFSPEHSVLQDVTAHGHLYVLRSMTKFYAIPGLRVGFLAGPQAGIARLASAREPWTLSTPALAAAKACLTAEKFRQQSLERLPGLRESLAKELFALGVQVFPGAANYLLLRLPEDGPDAGAVSAGLAERGILVRNCGNFAFLDERYVRVAVRLPAENRRLLEELGKLLRRGGER